MEADKNPVEQFSYELADSLGQASSVGERQIGPNSKEFVRPGTTLPFLRLDPG
jgi:hypothetical protein